MKKLISVISLVILIFSLVGCSNNPSISTTTTPQNIAVESETEAKPLITDYSLTGMMNVTDVHFSGKTSSGSYSEVGYNGVETATCITIDVICPFCNYETFVIVDFSEIPENFIGQPMFTWSGEEECWDWNKHSNPSDNIKYSIMFTLDN